jgi:hypothetical protein
MLALVLLGESFVARGSLDFFDMDDWAHVRSAKTAAKQAKGFDVLVFGDSLMKLGVVPRAVEERSGLKVANLAVSGSQAPMTAALLRRALDSGARPKAVVVDFQPPLLRLGPRHNLHRWADVLGPVEAARLALSARDADLFATVFLGSVLPSYRLRSGVRDNLMGALNGTGDRRRYNNFLAFRNWGRNGGAQLMNAGPTMPGMTDAEADALRRAFYPEWVCHPANVAGVERFLSLAAARGVPVYWVLPPLLPIYRQKLASSGIDAAHERFLRSFQARYPNLVVIDARDGLTEPAGFFDQNHLSSTGAFAFSLALGDLLRHARAGSVPADRWAFVPTFHPTPVPAGLEDLGQSIAALAALGQAGRDTARH